MTPYAIGRAKSVRVHHGWHEVVWGIIPRFKVTRSPFSESKRAELEPAHAAGQRQCTSVAIPASKQTVLKSKYTIVLTAYLVCCILGTTFGTGAADAGTAFGVTAALLALPLAFLYIVMNVFDRSRERSGRRLDSWVAVLLVSVAVVVAWAPLRIAQFVIGTSKGWLVSAGTILGLGTYLLAIAAVVVIAVSGVAAVCTLLLNRR